MKGYIPIRAPYIYGSKDTAHKISDKIPVYVVSAKETNPPEGLETIDWTLLTNVPVNNTLDAVSYTHLDVYKRQALYIKVIF